MPQSRDLKCNIFPRLEILKMRYVSNFCKINIVESCKKCQLGKQDHIFYIQIYSPIKEKLVHLASILGDKEINLLPSGFSFDKRSYILIRFRAGQI